MEDIAGGGSGEEEEEEGGAAWSDCEVLVSAAVEGGRTGNVGGVILAGDGAVAAAARWEYDLRGAEE